MGSNQPIGGRNNEGGYRFDELLRLCVEMWGASEQSLEWNLRNSDGMVVYVCRRCGLLAVEVKVRGAPPPSWNPRRLRVPAGASPAGRSRARVCQLSV